MLFIKKLGLFILLCCITVVSCLGQIVKVPLSSKLGYGTIGQPITNGLNIVDSDYIYRGIDTNRFIKHAIKQISFLQLQEEINEFINTRTNKAKALAWLSKYNAVDTSTLQYTKVLKNRVAYLWGIDSTKKVHFIMDSNNNFDFDDDTEYVFDPNSNTNLYPIVHVKFQYYSGNKLNDISVPYEALLGKEVPQAYVNDEPIFTDIDMVFLPQSYKVGELNIGKKKFIFNILQNSMGVDKNEKFKLTVQDASKISDIDPPIVYRSNQFIQFNNRLYAVDSISNNFLYLSFIKKIVYNGAEINSMAPPLQGTDIIKGTEFSLMRYKGKYVLLNFWGSWCKPCIGELPKLKELKQMYPDVQFVSIASDRKEDLLKLKSLITSNNLDWPQLFVDRDSMSSTGILWDYKINTFPTTLLIEPGGKVVIRGIGEMAIEEIHSFLKKLIIQ